MRLLCATAATACSSMALAQDAMMDLTQVHSDASGRRAERESREGLHGLLGASLASGERSIGGRGYGTGILPLVFLNHENRAYWTLTSGGVWLAQSDDRSLRIGVGARLHGGWHASDDPLLAGMQTRRSSIDGSFNLSWRAGGFGVRLAYYSDLGNASNGDSASLGLSRGFRIGERALLIPNLGLNWDSARVVDYYYGVRPGEVTAARPAYSGRESTSLRAGLVAVRALEGSWVLVGGASMTRLGQGITDSPIVTRRATAAVHVGAGWRF